MNFPNQTNLTKQKQNSNKKFSLPFLFDGIFITSKMKNKYLYHLSVEVLYQIFPSPRWIAFTNKQDCLSSLAKQDYFAEYFCIFITNVEI